MTAATAEDVTYEDEGVDEGAREQRELLERVKSDTALMQKIKRAAEDLKQLKAERQAINERMKAIREDIVSEGINRQAFAAATARWELEATDREAREASYHVCCAALGVEHQRDLFEEVVDNAQIPKEENYQPGLHPGPAAVN